MRILHLVGRSHRRGAELVASELAEELDARGHEDTVLAVGLGHDGGSDPAVPYLVGAVHERPHSVALAALRLRRRLRSSPFDVVVAHGGTAMEVAALAVPASGPPLVWQRIMVFPEKVWGSARQRWYGHVAGRARATVAITDLMVDEQRRLGYRGEIWSIPNFRRPDRFLGVDRAVARAALRRDLDLPAHAAVVGLVGHLVPQKRPERAVAVLDAVRASGQDAHLVVVGGGPLAGAVADEVARRGLGAHVSLLGHRPDVEHVLAGLDVLVLTSEDEGVPGIVIEAHMAACPVVTFPVGGVADVVVDGTGVVLDGHDDAAMAEAVAGLLRDPERAAAMGRLGQERSERFSLDAVAGLYEERLTALLAAPPRAAGVPSA